MKLEDIINEYYVKLNDPGVKVNKEYKDYIIEKEEKNIKIKIKSTKGKPLLSFTYYLIGSFDIQRELWVWSRNNPFIPKKMLDYSDEIDKYKNNMVNMMPKYKDHKYIESMYKYLSNEVIHISPENLFSLVKMCLFILKLKGSFVETVEVDGIKKMDIYVIKDISLNSL